MSARTIGVISDTHGLLRPQALAALAGGDVRHSHRPRIEERDGVLFVNPGSAGPRRFTLPIATARLRVERGAVTGEIVLLDV